MSCGPSRGAWEAWSLFGISTSAGTRSPSCLKVSGLARRPLRVESPLLGTWALAAPGALPSPPPFASAELAELPLVRLDFSCNLVTRLPVCFRLLRHLQCILLENNPLQFPPAQVGSRDGQAPVPSGASERICPSRLGCSLAGWTKAAWRASTGPWRAPPHPRWPGQGGPAEGLLVPNLTGSRSCRSA